LTRGSGRSRSSITDRAAGAAVDRVVDLVHGCTVHRSLKAKGYAIRAVGFAIYGCGRTHTTDGGARPTCGGARPGLHRKFVGDLDLGALVHGFECGFVLHEVEELANLSRPKGWWLG
jgi:hypothetical protein